MTDVLVGVIVPYARFLEVRARRLDIVAELADPAPQGPINVAVASTPMSNEKVACAAMRVAATSPAAGVQQ